MQSTRLYCYSGDGRKYVAAAQGEEWRCDFRVREREGLNRLEP